jgi:hypothetical protein
VDAPRNVTPPEEQAELNMDGSSTTIPPGQRGAAQDWSGATWNTGRGRSFPWLGILLVLVGVALLIQAALPTYVTTGTVLLIAIGVALIAGWLFSGSWLAIIPGLLLLALGIANLIRELNIYTGPGITAFSLAVAFVLIWAIGLARDRPSRWPLVLAGILGLVGAVQIVGRLSAVPELGFVWPIVIVAVGVLLLINARRN